MMLAAWLCASLPAVSAAVVRNPDMFTLADVGEVTSLDPAVPYDALSQAVIFNLYDTLIGYDGSSLSRFVPLLATAVPSLKNGGISPDGKTYRFHIRKGVLFHDGRGMTASDVKYSLMRFMLLDHAGGPSSLFLEPILGVESTRDAQGKIDAGLYDKADRAIVVDGNDVIIHLVRPFAAFLSIMARWSYVESQSWAVEHGDWEGTSASWQKFNNPEKGATYFNAHVNATGPFKLERWDVGAKYVLMSRNESYWRKPAGLKRVLVKTVPEFETRKLMLEAGDADLIDTPRQLLSQLAGIAGVTIVDHLPRLIDDPAIFFTFKINPVANPDIGSAKLDGRGIAPDFFSDIDVRQGFSQAFDYDRYLKETFKGAAVRAKGPVPPGVPGYDPDEKGYSFDLKKAAEHLRKAWGGDVWRKGFRFTLTYNVGSERRQTACEVLKKGLESLNPLFHVDLRGVEWAAFLDRAERRQMPAFSRGWYGDYPDAHDFVHAFYHSQGRYATAQGFSDPELDAWIEQAVAEVRPARRLILYKKIIGRGHELAPCLFTVHPSGVYAMRSWVKGFVDNPVNLGINFYPLQK
jgi:peptide/nickel transport system substrate-binding protein